MTVVQIVNAADADTTTSRGVGFELAKFMRSSEASPPLMNCFRTGQANAFIDSLAAST